MFVTAVCFLFLVKNSQVIKKCRSGISLLRRHSLGSSRPKNVCVGGYSEIANIKNRLAGCQVTSEKQVLRQSETQPCMKNAQLRRTLQKLVKVPLRRNFTFLFSTFFRQNNLPPCTMSISSKKKKLKRLPSLKCRRSKSENFCPSLLEIGSRFFYLFIYLFIYPGASNLAELV